MYLLYVTCKISFMSSSIFTLWTKKSLKEFKCIPIISKLPKNKQMYGYNINNFIKIEIIHENPSLNIFDLLIHSNRPKTS